jgi:hypothetical protein
MKKLLLLTILLSILISCGGRKQVEKSLNSGNYDQAISTALKKLKTNKDKKRKQAYVIMLEDAYYKVVNRDLEQIERLKKDNNPELYKNIYDIYVNLDARQEAIKPILPLRVGNKIVSIPFNDYSDELLESREKVSDYMYEVGLELLESDDKFKIREAYKTYEYIESINPNYDKTRELMDEAYLRGLDYVIVSIENQTNQIIPRRLEDDLLNFDTYGLNQFWTVYHASQNEDTAYDYAMQLQLKQINISPERINERQYLRKKEIVDGWEYELDGNGNVVKDTLGNDIKIDKIVDVKCRFFEYNQSKSTQVLANVAYYDIKSNQLMESFPIDSEFIFENLYARIRGDKRALNSDDRKILRNERVPFPSNEQMVYDTGEDLKLKLKNIINSYRVRG